MKVTKQNDIGLTNIVNNNDEINVKSEVKEEQTVTVRERIRRVITFFTVEPFLICYLLPIASIAIDQLNLEKACRAGLRYNETVCEDIVQGIKNDTTTIATRGAASEVVTEMIAWRHPLQSGIPAILVLFIGAWSDRSGNRKALMLIPMLGEIISISGLLLTTYYFVEWPLWVTGLIEALPTALSGGSTVALMGTYSYLADTTTVESRTFRIGVLAVVVTLSFPLGSSISGILLQELGYYGVFAIQLTLHILGFIYTYFRIHDVKNEGTDEAFITKFIKFFNPYNVWDTISLLFVTPIKQRIRVILVICAHVLIIGPVMGESAVSYLYMINKYNMSSVHISLFRTYNTLMGTAGTMVAIALFSKYLKMNDSFIGIIATACKTLSSLVYSLAPNQQWFFSGPAFDFFGNSGTTAIRSLGTKVVDNDKVGKMCSLIGLVEALLPVAYVPLYSLTYKKTIDFWPGAVYLLGSAMTVPAFFVFSTLYVMHRKDERDVVKDPTAKEMHAHDNDVTSL